MQHRPAADVLQEAARRQSIEVRSFMNRSLFGSPRNIGLLLAAVAAVAGIAVLLEIFDGEPAEKRGASQPAAQGAPAHVEISDLDTEYQPALPPSPLPIAGRVVGPNLEGIPGLEVFCGPESATTGADGSFRFPEMVRRGPLPLSLRRGGEELARWQEVVVGDTPENPSGSVRAVRPWMLRWSITLGGGEWEANRAGGAQTILDLGMVLVEEWGRSGRVHFEGRGELPDGARIQGTVYFEGERHVAGAEPAMVHGGRFQMAFLLPEDFRFYSASYDLEASFSTDGEDPETVELWRRTHPELPWDSMTDVRSAHPIYVGFPEEELADNRRVEAYYSETLEAAKRLRTLLDRQTDRTLKLARGWDPALLEDREALRESWIIDGAVAPDGSFQESAWREFIDKSWRPKVRELRARHSGKADEKFQPATLVMGDLLNALLALSQMNSWVVYQKFGLPPHRLDFYHDEETPGGDLVLLREQIKYYLAFLDRFCHLVTPRPEPGLEAKDGDAGEPVPRPAPRQESAPPPPGKFR